MSEAFEKTIDINYKSALIWFDCNKPRNRPRLYSLDFVLHLLTLTRRGRESAFQSPFGLFQTEIMFICTVFKAKNKTNTNVYYYE